MTALAGAAPAAGTAAPVKMSGLVDVEEEETMTGATGVEETTGDEVVLGHDAQVWVMVVLLEAVTGETGVLWLVVVVFV